MSEERTSERFVFALPAFAVDSRPSTSSLAVRAALALSTVAFLRCRNVCNWRRRFSGAHRIVLNADLLDIFEIGGSSRALPKSYLGYPTGGPRNEVRIDHSLQEFGCDRLLKNRKATREESDMPGFPTRLDRREPRIETRKVQKITLSPKIAHGFQIRKRVVEFVFNCE